MKNKTRDIAIIGMACRLPGDICTPGSFWDHLIQGHDLVSEIPDNRWEKSLFGHPNPSEAGKSYTFKAGTLGDVSGFDATFFGISPREAEQMDPQQRLLLEMTWEALERGGQIPEHIAGSDCAVYIGIAGTDYADIRQDDVCGANAYFMLGSTHSIAANRISYIFDLKGPSMAVDTACSSALVAMHEAVQAIRAGRSSMAIVGGISMLLSPYPFGGFSKASMLSPQGQCRAFDKMAEGYVRAEGGGVTVLKPLADAERDGDPIQAVIRGIGINTDGRTPGIAMPSPLMQEELIRKTYRQARINPRQVSYFEAHGTGTAVGDPVECMAIGNAIGRRKLKKDPLLIGSVKTNIGHLEPASGMAGVIKGVMALRHRMAPPSLHFDTPNPNIDFKALNLKVVTKPTPFTDTGKPAIVGVNSFGFGGANAHVILEEYVPTPKTAAVENSSHPAALYLSARSPEALRETARQMAEFLNADDAPTYDDTAYTAAMRRTRHDQRLVARFDDSQDLIEGLRAFSINEDVPKNITSDTAVESKAPLALVFSGNGAQWLGMGVQLLDEDPVFYDVIERVDVLIQKAEGWSVLDELRAAKEVSRLDDTLVAQPLLFAMQAGVVESLKSRGLKFGAVAGHSVGELAAAYAAGVLTLEQGIHVIVNRSFLQQHTKGLGRMAATNLTVERAQNEITPFNGRIEIAAINSPDSVTLSGEEGALVELGEKLKAERTTFQILDLDFAFHNRVLDPYRDELIEGLKDLEPGQETARFFSSVTGREMAGAELDAAYWWNNVRHTVQFSAAVTAMAEAGFHLFMEVGPHPIMQSYLRKTLRDVDRPTQALSVTNRKNAGAKRLARTVDQAYTLGAELDWQHLFPITGQVVELPTYPWQHESFWFRDTPEARNSPYIQPLLGVKVAQDVTTWETQLDPHLFPFLADHVVGGSVVFPATGFVELALEASRQIFNDDRHDIEHLEIRRPLVLSCDHSKMVRFTWNPEDNIFHIESRTRMNDMAWSRHATGRLSKAVHGEAQPPQGVDLSTTASQHYDIKQHYDFAERLGLSYGPHFQTVRKVAVTNNTAIAELELHTGENAPKAELFELHPTLFDGCLQALFNIVRDRTEGQEPEAFLPYQFGRIKTYSHGATPARCRVVLNKVGPRSMVATFTLMDAQNAVVAEVSDVRFQRATLKRHRDLSRMYFQFEPTPLPVYDAASSLPLIPVGEFASESPSSSEPELLRLAGTFAVQALRGMGGEEPFTTDSLMETTNTAPQQRPLITAMIALGEDCGLMDGDDTGWRVKAGAPSDPEHDWRKFLSQRPDLLAELTLLGRAGRHLPASLRAGKEISLQHGTAMLEHFFDASLTLAPANDALVAAVTQVASTWPPHRPLRILEVGGGAGGLTKHLIAHLPTGRFNYLVTDIDEMALAHTASTFAERAEVQTAVLDLLGSPEDQDEIERHAYDLVIGAHALQACDVPELALKNLSSLCRPGGLVMLCEPTPSGWLNLAFGLNPTWWHKGSALHGGLRTSEAWRQAAQDAGLDGVITRTIGGGHVLIGNAVALDEDVTLAPLAPSNDTLTPEPWLIVAGETGPEAQLADALEEQLLQADFPIFRITPEIPGDAELNDERVYVDVGSAESWSTLWHDLGEIGGAPAGVVHLLGIDEDANSDDEHMATQDRRCWTALALAQGIAAAAPATQPRMVLVTDRAQSLPAPFGEKGESNVPNPTQAPLWGIGRVLQNEQPQLNCHLIDLHPGKAELASLSAALTAEIIGDHSECEVLLAPDRRLAPRLRQATPANPTDKTYTQEGRGQKLVFTPGALDQLHWASSSRRAPAAGEVEIAVRAAGLNFRDVMFALGILPDEAVENGFAGATLGMEASGTITRVGPNTDNLKPGDNVLFFAPSCFASHVTTKAKTVAVMPKNMSFEQAATVPTVFFTVYYALHHLAQLEPGERILIHGAAGGVGMAAIQYALSIGAEIYATAGTDEKRDIVRMLGVPDDHVLDSRSTAFGDEVMALTHGEGVDVVLNSLAGEAIHRSLMTLRPFGRFLELGKRDFYDNSRLGLRPFRNNISYFGIDADQLMIEKPALATRLFHDMTALFTSGSIHPIPYRTFTQNRIIEAFRHMQQSRHMGKIVLTMQEPEGEAPEHKRTDAPTQLSLDPHGAYLVTGGLGGFGLETAKWLTTKGARHLVLVSRRGVAEDAEQEQLAALERSGVTIEARACDVSDGQAVADLISDINQAQPLKGVIHAAAVFDDGVIANMTQAQFQRVLSPKVAGGWALHAATQNLPLEFFVVYSSISTVLGNPGQASYVAANIYLETLVKHRRSIGLPGLAVCWGAISDVGYLARNAETGEKLQSRIGAAALTSTEAMQGLETLLLAHADTAAVVDLDWKMLKSGLPAVRAPKFGELARSSGSGDSSEESVDIHELIAGLSPDEVSELLLEHLAEQVGHVLLIPADKVDLKKSIFDMGMDSLMALELSMLIEEKFGFEVPPMAIGEGASITALADRIRDFLIGDDEDEKGPQTANADDANLKALAQRHSEDVDSDEIRKTIDDLDKTSPDHKNKVKLIS